MHRRTLMLAAPAIVAASGARAQAAPLPFYTAGPGSAFLPYGEALARFLSPRGVAVEVRRSAGSLENLRRVEDEPGAIGTAFLGSVVDALQGTPAAGGRRHRAVRALSPMYETGFMAAAPRARGLVRFADLAGRKVGCGPARGPAETFFRAAAEVAGISAEIVSGDSAPLAEAVLRGEIDALWQGAVLPIPALVRVADGVDSVIIGPGEEIARGVVARLPHLAPLTVAAGTYRGQDAPVFSFAAWNFVIANAALPEEVAYALTRAVLSSSDPRREISAAAAGTRAENAGTNRVLTFHPGAAQALREAGAAVPEIAAPA
ncbi:TAXI family TRAP transporter solute-binding subunit [Falsiroseomonas tokyonensis]|uniref:TAXI family TRAP transporter solute-binding subunit n=1 Tax=Falsiroseomonas tokyonensis TaxID=430521 RepID=A0ABV7BW96_9PROT|nr:TAXI family TRAP transporter solute-binding subunit [Falsiroseomonas tokyonensis]MBU8539808.1 TAXI family TRAP transporter solute-binding subunit [Falsiroseomonas tokyonensis]